MHIKFTLGLVLFLSASQAQANYWAKVDKDGDVVGVIVADKEFVDKHPPAEAGSSWVDVDPTGKGGRGMVGTGWVLSPGSKDFKRKPKKDNGNGNDKDSVFK